MLYSKNGSIPKPETDGTSGWIEVPEPPVAPAGKEVVWWYPPGWVVRDIKPAATETTDYSWSQSEERWVAYELPVIDPVVETTVTTDGSATVDLSLGTAQPTTEI